MKYTSQGHLLHVHVKIPEGLQFGYNNLSVVFDGLCFVKVCRSWRCCSNLVSSILMSWCSGVGNLPGVLIRRCAQVWLVLG